MYIDSHCHLNHDRLLNIGGPDEVVARAQNAGISGMVSICCRVSDEFSGILALVRGREGVWCSIGTHPHEAGDPAEQAVSLDRLITLANSDPKIIGIGESGLDYFYKHATPEDQQEQFRKHIRACIACDLPLIVHSRDADADTMRIIREEGAGTKLKGVMHCFSSGRAMGEDALDFGFYISFSGIVTFPKAPDLRDFAKDVPLERILIETDSPYLAPEPFRGKINEPAFVKNTCAVVAMLKGVAGEDMARQTTENFFRLFDKAKP